MSDLDPSHLSDRELLIQIHGDVKYTKNGLENHIKECQGIRDKYITPLWNEHQQNIGADKAIEQTEKKNELVGKVVGYCINAGISVTAAWAAIRAMRP